MNLSGLCGADPTACQASGQAPPGSAAAEGFNPQIAEAAVQQYPAIASAVSGALYRIAARIGRNYVCPHMIGIGETIGGGIAAAMLPAEIVLLNVAGVAISIPSVLIGAGIGREVGREVQSVLCSQIPFRGF